MSKLKLTQDQIAIELESQGFCELFDGLCMYDRETIIEEQKDWSEFDEYKKFDFTSSPYWITTDNGAGVYPIQDEDDFQKWAKENT